MDLQLLAICTIVQRSSVANDTADSNNGPKEAETPFLVGPPLN